MVVDGPCRLQAPELEIWRIPRMRSSENAVKGHNRRKVIKWLSYEKLLLGYCSLSHILRMRRKNPGLPIEVRVVH